MSKQEIIDRIRSNFPQELQELDQWVCWKYEQRKGEDKPTKVPYDALRPGDRAESDNPSTWATFDRACHAYLKGNYDGIGFVFSEHDPYAGVDFDKCIQAGIVRADRAEQVNALASYSEKSPSGTGIHTFVRGVIPGERRKSVQHNIEMYDDRRIFTVTGDILPDSPKTINYRQPQLKSLYAALFPVEQRPAPAQPVSVDDRALLDLMFASRNGASIQALWDGNTAGHNSDDSSADLALCNYLAFWTGADPERMDRLFRQSRLYRDKWDRKDYRQRTIHKAIASCSEVYTPRATKPATNGYHKPAEPPEWAAEPPDEMKATPPTTRQQIKDETYLLTEGISDEGNAHCLNQLYEDRFLYTEALGWLHYTGQHWTSKGADAAVNRAIVDTLAARIKAALKDDPEKHEKLIKFCIPNKGRVQGAMYLLQSLVAADIDEFDAEPDLLNCKNGVVDLRTGVLSPHNPAQRFTHCTNVDYNPTADPAPFLNWITGAVEGGKETVSWLQMAIGYSLTGHTREEILFYLYGPPRSGKGTLTEMLLALLGGTLAKEVNFGTFTAQRTGDSQNFDLAPLKPCRMVMASESNAYERFNEAKVKMLTGGNEVYCAFKHQTHFGYRPQYKIWLSSNQTVNADPDDDAVWGRLRVIVFPYSHLGTEDKTLKHEMRSAAVLEGALAWAVAGAQKWYALGKAGLPELATSATAKNEHRAELDNVQAWIEESCEQTDVFCSSATLYQSYEDWCKHRGIEPKKQKGFSQALIRKGFNFKFAKIEGRVIRGFMGLRVL